MSPGLLEWPWTRRLPTLFHSCSIFSCSWLLLISLSLLFMSPFFFRCAPAHLLWAWQSGNYVCQLGFWFSCCDRDHAVQPSKALLLQVIMQLKFLMSCWQQLVAVLASFIKLLPTHPHAHGPIYTRGKRKSGAGSFLLRVWPRSETCHFHSFPIG